MTDRELLEKAAIAADMDYDPESAWPWNPLEDDGQALRLAVTLLSDKKLDFIRLQIERDSCDDHGVSLVYSTPPHSPEAVRAQFGKWVNCQWNPGDPYAATRRAIVRAAAAIGETL